MGDLFVKVRRLGKGVEAVVFEVLRIFKVEPVPDGSEGFAFRQNLRRHIRASVNGGQRRISVVHPHRHH